MLGRELRYLAEVADLARVDLEGAALTLDAQGGVVTSLYVGSYSGGWRRVVDHNQTDFNISVQATRAKQQMGLFRDDESVQVLGDPARLSLRSDSGNLSLNAWNVPRDIDEVGEDVAGDDVQGALRMSLAELTDEVAVAANYVAEHPVRPIMAGIRLQADRGTLILTAFDGFALLFQSAIKAKTMGSFDIVLSAQDLQLGLRLLAEPEADAFLIKPKNRDNAVLMNASKTAYFRCSGLLGSFPNVEQVTDAPVVGDRLVTDSDQIRLLVDAGAAVEAREVSLSGTLFSVTGERGTYTSKAKSKVNGNHMYDLAMLGKVGKLSSLLTMNVAPSGAAPTLIQAEHRRCWLSERVE